MCSLRSVSDRRITVALGLSAGRCAAVNSGQRSTVRVLHGDAAAGVPAGLAMVIPTMWSDDEENELQKQKGASAMLALRAPLVAAESGEAGTLPYRTYMQMMATHVATTLMRHDEVELLTVAHGATGSGKSTQIFEAAVGGLTDVGSCAYGCESGLFAAVLKHIFDATELEPCVAISVVEWRPSPTSSGMADGCIASRMSNSADDSEGGWEDRSMLNDDVVIEMEAVDLLSYAVDRFSPTGCFMEDYADIPAAHYVLCNNATEALALVRTALQHSLGWHLVGDVLPQGPVEAFGMPDTHLKPERRGSTSKLTEGCHHVLSEVYSPTTENEFLCPIAGANSHVLVTLLLCYNHSSSNDDIGDNNSCDCGDENYESVAGGGGCRRVVNIWRLWDLSGPSPWIDGGGLASRMAFATHTDMCQMTHRYMHRDQLQGGWWASDLPPRHINEVIPLCSTQHRKHGYAGMDKVATMIEAVLQHSCSSVLWIASLRFDARYDDINEDVLEAAASLSSGTDGINSRVIRELRRRRRQENLNAAERVMNIFALPFGSHFQSSQCVGCHNPDPPSAAPGATSDAVDINSISTSAASLPIAAVPLTVSETRAPTPTRASQLTVPNMFTPATVDATIAKVADTKTASQEIFRNSPEHTSFAAGPHSDTGTTTAIANGTLPPWRIFVESQSCLAAQQNEACSALRLEQQQEAHHPLPTPPPCQVSLCAKTDISYEEAGTGSPALPLSVSDTGHLKFVSNGRETSRDLLWDRVTEEVEALPVVLLQEDNHGDYNNALVASAGCCSGSSNSSSCCGKGQYEQNEWPADIASTVRHLLEEPLARLQEISLRYKEEWMQNHRCLIARLNALLCSDASTLGDLQRSVKNIILELKVPSDCGSVDRSKESSGDHESEATQSPSHHAEKVARACGLPISPKKSLESETPTVNGNRNASPCRFNGRKRHEDGAKSTEKQLIASEREIYLLRQRLAVLEQENTELRKRLSLSSLPCDKLAVIQGLRDVFNNILQCSSALHAQKAAEEDHVNGKYEEVVATLQSLQQQPKQQLQVEAGQKNISEALVKTLEPPDTIMGLMGDTTEKCNGDKDAGNDKGLNHPCCSSGASAPHFPASSPSTHTRDLSTMHLNRILMRATRFATAPVSPEEGGTHVPQLQSHHQEQGNISTCFALSIDHGSDLSLPAREEGVNMCAGLRTFREAAQARGNSAHSNAECCKRNATEDVILASFRGWA